VRAAQAVSYVGAGTVEFLVDAHRNFYFLEMNTRLQVEHPVTEWCTGLDLVKLQIEVAARAPLPLAQADVAPHGHAIEARIYAEDPDRNFMPSPGRIQALRVPAGPFVRDDGAVYPGYIVPIYYDPMISKLSVWAPDRAQAIERLRRALSEYVVTGIATNVQYLRRVLGHADFRRGDYDTSFLTLRAKDLLAVPDPADAVPAALAAALREEREAFSRAVAPSAAVTSSGWRRFEVGRGWGR
jgi:acetyl-CoA carboxylase biotin carboxylase subunit